MLSGSRILVTTADGAVAPFSPVAPVRSSAGLGWQGLYLEEHATPPMVMEAWAPQEDLVWLQLQPARRSRAAAGRQLAGAAHRGGHRGRAAARRRARQPLAQRGAGADRGAARDPARPRRRIAGPAQQLLAPATGRDSAARHLILALRDEVESGGAGGLLFADSIGMALAVHVLRRYAAAIAVRGGDGRLSTPQLRAALDFIAAHLADNPSLAEVSAAPALSPTTSRAASRRASASAHTSSCCGRASSAPRRC